MERKSAARRGPKHKRKATANQTRMAEDPACARAWDRLDQAEQRLLHDGGKAVEPALDRFYDAWLERLAVMAEGGDGADGGSSAQLESAMALLTRTAASHKAEQAVMAFLEVAILEVEAAVLRMLTAGGPDLVEDRPSGRWELEVSRRTGNA